MIRKGAPLQAVAAALLLQAWRNIWIEDGMEVKSPWCFLYHTLWKITIVFR
jgi:hypothetical protein